MSESGSGAVSPGSSSFGAGADGGRRRASSAWRQELRLERKLLYCWRDSMRAAARRRCAALAAHRRLVAAEARRRLTSIRRRLGRQQQIEELERKIGQQQLDLDFFRAALRHVREHAGRTARLARRRLRRDPRADAAARPSRDRADVPAGRCQPGRLLSALAGLGAAPGGDGGARRDPASVAWRTGITATGGSPCC